MKQEPEKILIKNVVEFVKRMDSIIETYIQHFIEQMDEPDGDSS